MPQILRISLLLLLFCSTASAQGGQASVRGVLNYKSLQPGQQAVLAVVMDIRPGFHAQSHAPLGEFLIKYEVTVEPAPAIELSEPIYPAPTIEEYPALGRVSVYTGRTITYVPITVKADTSPGPFQLRAKIRYQICDDRQCFMPETSNLEVHSTIVPPGQTLESNEPELFSSFDPTSFVREVPPDPEVKLLGFELKRDAYPAAFFAALCVGVLFNVMPCVLPIVPLKAMGFYQAAQQHRGRSLALGAVFSAGIVATFGALAVPVVVLQEFAWGQLFGNAWFAAAIVIILLLVALGTFGAFSVILPRKVYEVTPSHETYLGNFLFGILTAILSTPCTFGMFLALLLWAASQPPVLGTSLVMTVGLGMAIPYLILAAFPQMARNLPRTGPWAEIVKQMMGFLLIATAVYFGQRFLPEALGERGFWWVIFGVIVAACLFLVGRTIQISLTPRAVGIAAVIALALLSSSGYAVSLLTYVPVKWVKFSPETFEQSLQSGKPVLVKFTASWCGNCQAIEATVYTNDETIRAIDDRNVIPVKADLTTSDAPGWALLRSLHPVGAIPFTAIYLPGESNPSKLAGIYTTAELIAALNVPPPESPTKP